MKFKQSSLNSSKGFSALELLVSTSIGLGIMAITLSLTQTSKFVLGRDIARTRVNQNLRGTIDIISSDIRIAGENLSKNFPVLLLSDDSAGDSLTLRRGLLSEALSVCNSISAGSSGNGKIVVGNLSTIPGCDYSSNKYAFDQFAAARTSLGAVRGFILNTGTNQGEFFNFSSETDSGTELALIHDTSAWSNDYPEGLSVVYLVEQHRYFLDGDRLKMVQNEDITNPKTISFGIDNFQANILTQDSTTHTSFSESDNWTEVKYLELTLNGSANHAGDKIKKSITGRLFPRNILSH